MLRFIANGNTKRYSHVEEFGYFLKAKHTFTMQLRNCTLPGIYPIDLKTSPHKNLQADVYHNLIHCQNLEATSFCRCPSVGKWITKL